MPILSRVARGHAPHARPRFGAPSKRYARLEPRFPVRSAEFCIVQGRQNRGRNKGEDFRRPTAGVDGTYYFDKLASLAKAPPYRHSRSSSASAV